MTGLQMNEMRVHSYCGEESYFSEVLYGFKARKTKYNIQNTYKNDKVCNQIWPDRPRVGVCQLCHVVWGYLGTFPETSGTRVGMERCHFVTLHSSLLRSRRSRSKLKHPACISLCTSTSVMENRRQIQGL